MVRKPKNPIDPETGKRKRGRPPKAKPVDSISGPQPKEMAVAATQEPVEVRHLDPKDETSTELAELWKKRFRGTAMMDIPQELAKRYPSGQFCWARDTKESVSRYKNRFGYEPAETTNPLPGQTDSCFRHGDAILMVRPQWMKPVHDEVRRERLLSQLGNPQPTEFDERGAERDALREAAASGYGKANRAISFFAEETSEDADRVEAEEKVVRKQAFMNQPGRTRLSTGTKYVGGGIPS